MILNIVRDLVTQAVEQARRDGLLELETIPEIQVGRPDHPERGDFDTALSFSLARAAHANPFQVAEFLVQRIPASEQVERAVAVAPGFINFYLNDSWVQQQVEEIRLAGPEYGNLDVGEGRRVLVEFVSANPTGPVHVGQVRGAVLGSTLAKVLAAAGYDVTQEYFIKDAGSKMYSFSASVYVRYKQALGQSADLPANGYAGEYITALAEEIARSEGARFLETDEEHGIKRDWRPCPGKDGRVDSR